MYMPSHNPNPKLEFTEQFEMEDGARWRVFEDPGDHRRYAVMTSAGQERLKGEEQDSIRALIDQYRVAELGGIALLGENPNIRQELGRGQEATVYSMGNFAVREERGIKDLYASIGQLERMDAISGFIDAGMPRWLNLPSHYALYSDPERQKTYTLMDRINGGLTAEDVINYPEVPESKSALIDKVIKPYIEDAKVRVPELFDEAHSILSASIKNAGKDPAKYLTDWHPRNAIIERRETPVAGSQYTLNVIDQYRS